MTEPAAAVKQRCRRMVQRAITAGRLNRPDRCVRCEAACTPHGHHHDYSKPLDVEWLCLDCHAVEHQQEPVWTPRARHLRASGMTYAAVASNLGLSETTVYKRLNPERTRRYNRQSNARRGRQKLDWAAGQARRPERRGRCQRCDGEMGIGVLQDGECARCRTKRVNEEAQTAERMWSQGAAFIEIAEHLGRSKGSLSGMFSQWRSEGRDLPRRYAVKQKHLATSS